MDFDLRDPFFFHSYREEEEEEETDEEEEQQQQQQQQQQQTRHPPPPISDLFATEIDHMSCREKLDPLLPLRRNAVSLLLQAQRECNMGCFVPYLTVNYLDRFLSRREIPSDKPWIMELLSVACLSLASKMTKTHFSSCDLAGMVGAACSAETIQRMELLVLSTLEWRMRSVTPFSFLAFFLGLFRSQDPPSISALFARATQLIFKLQAETKLLDYKPSIVAASALLTAAHELFPLLFPSFHNSILSCSYVDKEDLLGCCNLVEKRATELEMEHGYQAPATSVLGCCRDHPSSSENEIAGHSSDAQTAAIAKKKRRISGFYRRDYVAPLIIMPSTTRK